MATEQQYSRGETVTQIVEDPAQKARIIDTVSELGSYCGTAIIDAPRRVARQLRRQR